jgi:hypothetical protein
MKHFLLSSLLFLSQAAYSCTCLPLGTIDKVQYNSYNLIVKGKITNVVDKDFVRFIYIRVDTYFKGKRKARIIIIESPSQSGMCSIFPKIGEQWLIFARKKDNVFYTNLCTRTINLNPKAWNYNKEKIDADLSFLNGIDNGG